MQIGLKGRSGLEEGVLYTHLPKVSWAVMLTSASMSPKPQDQSPPKALFRTGSVILTLVVSMEALGGRGVTGPRS